MNVFLTGATGYVGGRLLKRFLACGHRVTALCRDAQARSAIEAHGAATVLGDLNELESYLPVATTADAVVHAGFAYDTRGAECAETDQRATRAMLRARAQLRQNAPSSVFIYTSSVFLLASAPGWRLELEREVLAERASRAVVVRLGWVYGDGGGTLLQVFKPNESGLVPYPNDGANRLPVVHVLDVAELYASLLDGEACGVFHAVEVPLETRTIARAAAEVAGAGGITRVEGPELLSAFGTAAELVSLDLPVTAQGTIRIGWRSGQPSRFSSAELIGSPR